MRLLGIAVTRLAGHHPCSEPGNAPDEGAGLNPELAHVYGQGIGGDAAKLPFIQKLSTVPTFYGAIIAPKLWGSFSRKYSKIIDVK